MAPLGDATSGAVEKGSAIRVILPERRRSHVMLEPNLESIELAMRIEVRASCSLLEVVMESSLTKRTQELGFGDGSGH